MRLKIIYLIALILLISCDNKKNSDSELFIGAYRTMDQLVPYPYLIQQKNDSLYLIDNQGVFIDKVVNREIKQDREIQFKQKKLKILKTKNDGFIAFDLSDTLNFRLFHNGEASPKSGAKFEKIVNIKRLDNQKIKEEIDDFIWKYEVIDDENSNPNKDLEIQKILHFENNSLTILTNYFYQGLKTYSEFETKAYHIFKLDDAFFLSFQKEIDNPQSIFQIVGYDSKTIELKDFSSRDIKNISFVKDSMDKKDFKELLKKTSNYSNCFDGYQGEYYFGEDVTFKNGNHYILNYVNNNIPKIDTKSGYIIIHFNINCSGDIGRFGLIQMNREFKETDFSKKLINHLINKVSHLKDFPSSLSQLEWLNYKDIHAFLMFKIVNGKIVDVCP